MSCPGAVRFERDGLVVTLKHSKTDQEGEGRRGGLPYGSRPETCPVRALQDWLAAGGIAAGPLFRAVDRHGRVGAGRLSDRAVALVVQRAAAAAQAGVRERAIMVQTDHRALTMVRRSIREGSLFRDNAAAAVGL